MSKKENILDTDKRKRPVKQNSNKRSPKAKSSRKSNKFLSILKVIAIVVSLVLAVVYLLSAFAGYVNPLEDTRWAYIGMTYPILFILMIVGWVLWAIARKWVMTAIMFLALIATYNEIMTFSPINWPWASADDGEKEFSVLTYNVMDFSDFDENAQAKQNRTIDFILNKDADIVCLQEVRPGGAFELGKNGITKEQINSINHKYPHQWTGHRDLCVMSKFPITHVRTISTVKSYGCDLYEINIEGKTLTLVNVHLQSIGLSMTDKELYYNITSIDRTQENIDSMKANIKSVRLNLLSKLGDAFRERARQAKRIRDILSNIDGDIILCGDFNDTPGSYAYRQVASQLHDAYRDCAFGPTITYHDNRFYFRIDHVFYRGDDLKVLEIEHCKNNSSDHSAIFTTFAINIHPNNTHL